MMGQNLFQRRRKLYLRQQQLELQNIEAFPNQPAFEENMNDLYNNNKIIQVIPHNAFQVRQNRLEQRKKLLLQWRQQIMMQNQQQLIKTLPIRENMNEMFNNNNNKIAPNVAFQGQQHQRHQFHHHPYDNRQSINVKSENSQSLLEHRPNKYQSSLDVFNSQLSLTVAKNSDVQNNNIWIENTKSNKNLPLFYQIKSDMTG